MGKGGLFFFFFFFFFFCIDQAKLTQIIKMKQFKKKTKTKNKKQKTKKQRSGKEEDKDRIQSQMIDWKDFVVVETIVFDDLKKVKKK